MSEQEETITAQAVPQNIYQKLVAVMQHVQSIPKAQRNSHQGWVFRGIDDFMNAVGPALRANGVVVVPSVLDIQREHSTNARGGAVREVVVTVKYQMISADDGSSIESVMVGESVDNSDKATAQALAVAYREFWKQLLCVPTNEPDPDMYSPELGQRSQSRYAEVTDEQAVKELQHCVENAATKSELRDMYPRILKPEKFTQLDYAAYNAKIIEHAKTLPENLRYDSGG